MSNVGRHGDELWQNLLEAACAVDLTYENTPEHTEALRELHCAIDAVLPPMSGEELANVLLAARVERPR